MKKNLLLLAVFTVVAFNANAQFGKSLKNIGKSVGGAVASAAGDMASDVAASKVSDKVVAFMDSNNKLLDASSDYTKRLANLVSANLITVDGLSFTYAVYDSGEANILACANGAIRVYSGMMDLLTDDELVAVIANQVGHVVNKDVRNSLLKVANADQASGAATAQLEKMLSFSGDKLGSVVNELLQVPYTVDQSKAADQYAAAFLKNNGKSVEALTAALGKFAVMEDNDKLAAADESGATEFSPATKYIKVNSGNADRAALLN